MLVKLKFNVIMVGNVFYLNVECINMVFEIKGNFNEVLGYVNVQDGQGNYIFVGFKSMM